MQKPGKTHILNPFQEALDREDPILAEAFANVSRQSAGDGQWQYLWPPNTQLNHNGQLLDDNALKVFNAHATAQANTPNPNPARIQFLAALIARNIVKPFKCCVRDFEIQQRTNPREPEGNLLHENHKHIIPSETCTPSLLLGDIKVLLFCAYDVIWEGLMNNEQAVYGPGDQRAGRSPLHSQHVA